MSPILLAQLSDPHVLVGAGDRGSAEALAAAVDAVLALCPLPDAVLITGDIADAGAPAEYERVHELLEPLPMPVHVLAGNHDDRDALRERFAVPGSGPLQARLEIGAAELALVEDTPAFALHAALDGGLVSHVQPL